MNRFWLQSSVTLSERGRGNAAQGLQRAQLRRMLSGAAEQCQEAAAWGGLILPLIEHSWVHLGRLELHRGKFCNRCTELQSVQTESKAVVILQTCPQKSELQRLSSLGGLLSGSFSFSHREHLSLLLQRQGEKRICEESWRFCAGLPQCSHWTKGGCYLTLLGSDAGEMAFFFSLLPWRWWDQTINELSDGAGNIMPYAAGWMEDNNPASQPSTYQNTSSRLW